MKYYHLAHVVHENAKKYAEDEAIKVRNESTGLWHSISWNEFSNKVMMIAGAMCHIGIKYKDNIGIYSQNMAECLYVDFGAFANRAVMVPMYATSSIPQISYIINETEIELLFVGEQWQYDNAYLVQQESRFLKQIVIFDSKVIKNEKDRTSLYFDEFCSPKMRNSEDMLTVEKRMKEVKETDLAHIIYTSGTTGESKGVMLSHNNYLKVCHTHDVRLNYLPKRFLSICFLPMTHIFEKAWSIYCIHKGCTLAISFDPREIQTYLKEVRPEAMCSVPRFWEKVYAGVQEKIDSYPSLLKNIFLDALKTGKKHNLDYRNKSKKAPWGTRIKFHLYNATVYKILKKQIGIERGLIFPTAGAALSERINVFLQSVNIPIIYGYGLTETTATVSCFPQIGFEMGTVGKIMPETEVRIGENNEILVRGESVTQGYYKKPEATKEAFTEDGYFRTGDAGKLTEENGIILTERIKDLYKTSNGKYIAPQQLEGRLTDDKYIDNAIIIADQRKYVSALIIPAFEELKTFADQNNISYDSIEELIQKDQIIELFNTRIKAMQNEFATYEQIKRFELLSEPFTIQSGELTNTLKMKRAFITNKYQEIINKMYTD
ncbi:long-chain fatty acid--CoA ligase [Bacteroidales bacterium OttesenSCG-928-M11]|nr:long-chain fatty acid--CoA ligase [Bacteroidales bacterium OttesenSCG-928-M11]